MLARAAVGCKPMSGAGWVDSPRTMNVNQGSENGLDYRLATSTLVRNKMRTMGNHTTRSRLLGVHM